jgi:predicted Zn finger-like uncharacterized protein
VKPGELYTRCPTCKTVFRTHDAQLSVQAGKVRCGQCRMVFDGRAHIVDLAPRKSADDERMYGPPTVTLRESVALEPAHASEPREDFPPRAAAARTASRNYASSRRDGPWLEEPYGDLTIQESPPTDFPARSESAEHERHAGEGPDTAAQPPHHGTTDDAQAELPAGRTDASRVSPDDGHAVAAATPAESGVPRPTGASGVQGATDTIDASATSDASDADGANEARGTSDTIDAAGTSDTIDTTGASATSDPTSAIGTTGATGTSGPGDANGAHDASTASPGIEPTRHDDVVPFRWDEPAPRPLSREMRWALAGGSAFLALLLAGQMLFHFRHALAAGYPELRPALVEMCGIFGCRVEALKRRDEITIESHDMQADPAHQGLLILQVVLRNRATHAVAFPHLELEILDIGGQPQVRRAFAPVEYAGGAADFGRGIPAGAEWNVKLFIDASSVAARGYNLDLFYP